MRPSVLGRWSNVKPQVPPGCSQVAGQAQVARRQHGRPGLGRRLLGSCADAWCTRLTLPRLLSLPLGWPPLVSLWVLRPWPGWEALSAAMQTPSRTFSSQSRLPHPALDTGLGGAGSVPPHRPWSRSEQPHPMGWGHSVARCQLAKEVNMSGHGWHPAWPPYRTCHRPPHSACLPQEERRPRPCPWEDPAPLKEDFCGQILELQVGPVGVGQGTWSGPGTGLGSREAPVVS